MSEQTIKENESSAPRRSPWILVNFFLLILILFALCAASGYGYLQLKLLQAKDSNNGQQVSDLQGSLDELKRMTEKSAELSTQQEKMIADWQAAQKGNLNKWYVAEAQYLVRLANDHLQFTKNTSIAMTLLQQADQVLQHLQNANVEDIRRSIAANIATLQQNPTIDITSLYLQFSTLNQQLDQLILPPSPLKANPTPTPVVTDETETSWWKKGMNKSWEALQRIVIIRNSNTNMLPLIMPEEKIFLYQNLHAQMESVMWAVLHQNNEVYQASLSRTIAWIQQYFDQDAANTQTMLQNLLNLQKINLQPQAVNVTATLQLFDNYFANVAGNA